MLPLPPDQKIFCLGHIHKPEVKSKPSQLKIPLRQSESSFVVSVVGKSKSYLQKCEQRVILTRLLFQEKPCYTNF